MPWASKKVQNLVKPDNNQILVSAIYNKYLTLEFLWVQISDTVICLKSEPNVWFTDNVWKPLCLETKQLLTVRPSKWTYESKIFYKQKQLLSVENTYYCSSDFLLFYVNHCVIFFSGFCLRLFCLLIVSVCVGVSQRPGPDLWRGGRKVEALRPRRIPLLVISTCPSFFVQVSFFREVKLSPCPSNYMSSQETINIWNPDILKADKWVSVFQN